VVKNIFVVIFIGGIQILQMVIHLDILTLSSRDNYHLISYEQSYYPVTDHNKQAILASIENFSLYPLKNRQQKSPTPWSELGFIYSFII
jgi:hypothetical protein